MLYLIRNQAATPPELEARLLTTRATVTRNLQALRSMGIVRETGIVRRPYAAEGRGPKVKVWAIAGANAEAVLAAQQRYGELISRVVEDKPGESILDSYSEACRSFESRAQIVSYLKGKGVEASNRAALTDQIIMKIRETGP